jgi:KaiC/GvpD/RAD55 family RecA-like ATPase
MQFLVNGIKLNEPGVYLTLDERPELIREDMLRFGWNLRQMEDNGLLKLVDGTMAKLGMPSDEEFSLPATGFDLDKLLLELMRAIKKIKARRVVIDSIPALGLNFENEHEVRKAVLKMVYLLSRAGVTAVFTTEISEDSAQLGKYGVEEFVADGVVVLHYMGIGTQSNRTLHIRKMRATKHSEDLHPLTISDSGIKVHKVEEDYNV